MILIYLILVRVLFNVIAVIIDNLIILGKGCVMKLFNVTQIQTNFPKYFYYCILYTEAL